MSPSLLALGIPPGPLPPRLARLARRGAQLARTPRALDERAGGGFLYRVGDGAREIYRTLSDTVASVGLLQAAGACGIDSGDLRRSLDRNGRRVAVEHAMAIAAIAGYDERRQIVSTFARTAGFEVADQLPPMSDKERAARLEGALRALGPLGEQALLQALGGRR